MFSRLSTPPSLEFEGTEPQYVVHLCTRTYKVVQTPAESFISSTEGEKQRVIHELCAYKAMLKTFSQEKDDNIRNFKERRQYLREVLERLSESQKADLIERLGDEHANYLRLAILRAQCTEYEKKQTGFSGGLRVFGSAVGLSDSLRKRDFLANLVNNFSAKYFGGTVEAEILNFKDEAQQATLRQVILPGEKTLKTLSWLQDEYLKSLGVAELIQAVPQETPGIQQLLRRMTIRPGSLKSPEILVKDYLESILLSQLEAGDRTFQNEKEDVLRTSNLSEIVLRILPNYQAAFETIANALDNQGEYELAHERIERLREILTTLSPENRTQLISLFEPNAANYLRVAMLRSQYMTYWYGLMGPKGSVRAVGAALGLSQHRAKTIFLRNVAWDFAYTYKLGGGNCIALCPDSELYNYQDNPEWQRHLCETILPGSDAILETLQFLQPEYLEHIGVTQAINTMRENNQNMGTLAITIGIEGQDYVRIKRKIDGKNKGTYDGTYVVKKAYDLKTEEEKTELSAYQKEEIFFLKMFPSENKMVEGFSEAFVGRLIEAMIQNNFIQPEYQACFAPAKIIDLPDAAGPALWQPFALGAKLLYQCADEKLEAKPFWTELSGILLRTGGYERYLEKLSSQNHRGLSLIVMIMIWVGNYSVHSGNILVTSNEEMNIFTAIDYGAALRNFMGTRNQGDIWTPLETQLALLNSSGNGAFRRDKYYMEHYKTIPGFLENVVRHAQTLSENVLRQNLLFLEMIKGVTHEIYNLYKTAVILKEKEASWASARTALFAYIYGKCFDDIKERLSVMDDEEAQQELGNAICDIMLTRLTKIASYVVPTNGEEKQTCQNLRNRYQSVAYPQGFFAQISAAVAPSAAVADPEY